jgi:hypothetical protein
MRGVNTLAKTNPPAKVPEKKQEVATTTSAQLPAFMKGDIGKGLESVGISDYEMPRIALLQGLSDELQTYDGLKAGQFWHTLAEQGLGDTLDIVVLYVSKRYVLWRPRWDGGGILARSDDAVHWQPPQGEFTVKAYKDQDKRVTWKLAETVAASGLGEWGSYDPSDPKSQPAATLCYVVVVALPKHPELSPVALMLQRTSVGPARKLLGKLKISQAPSYGLKYTMSSFDDDRGGQKFKNYRFTAAGFVENEDEYNSYKLSHDRFAKEGVQIKDIEKAQDDNVGGGGDAASETKY